MWIARVPTDSNIADDPSRDIAEPLLELGAQRDSLNLEEVWHLHLPVSSANEGGNDQQLRPPSSEKDAV